MAGRTAGVSGCLRLSSLSSKTCYFTCWRMCRACRIRHHRRPTTITPVFNSHRATLWTKSLDPMLPFSCVGNLASTSYQNRKQPQLCDGSRQAGPETVCPHQTCSGPLCWPIFRLLTGVWHARKEASTIFSLDADLNCTHLTRCMWAAHD